MSAVDIPEAVKKKMSELTSRRSQNRKEMDEKRRNAKQEIDLVKQRSPAASGAGNKRKNSKDIMNEEDSVTTADDASKSAKERAARSLEESKTRLQQQSRQQATSREGKEETKQSREGEEEAKQKSSKGLDESSSTNKEPQKEKKRGLFGFFSRKDKDKDEDKGKEKDKDKETTKEN